jgi:hypothetical protein
MLNIPFWPFTVSIVRDITLEGIPTVMYIGARMDDGTAWEWGVILKDDDKERIGCYFAAALMAFQRAAKQRC